MQQQRESSGPKSMTQIDAVSSVAKHHASLRGKTLTGQPIPKGVAGKTSFKAASTASKPTPVSAKSSSPIDSVSSSTSSASAAPAESASPVFSSPAIDLVEDGHVDTPATLSQRSLSPLEEEQETVLLPQNSLPAQQQLYTHPSAQHPAALSSGIQPQRNLIASQTTATSSSRPHPPLNSSIVPQPPLSSSQPLSSASQPQPLLNSSLNSSNSDSSDIPTEETLPDGSTLISYRNGTRKTISTQGTVTCLFFNGDEKTVTSDGTTVSELSVMISLDETTVNGLKL